MTVTEPKVSHPCPFSDEILNVIRPMVRPTDRVLDPFAGVGKIHELNADTVGVELEPEWADMHPQTIVGDALALPFDDETFDVVATSPVFGNRMSDHHEARDDSKRITYRHQLGRKLHPNNAGQLQWGEKYRLFHAEAWAEAVRVLKPGGRFVLNVSDHIRSGVVQKVVEWHVDELQRLELQLVSDIEVPTRRMGFGANRNVRVEHEHVVVFNK